METCVQSGPFAPRALPRFLATMSPADSRPGRAPLWIPARRCAPHAAHHAGSPRFLDDLSTRALPNHPGGRRVHLLVASPPMAGFTSPEGWPPSLCNEAESGSRTLGSRLRCPTGPVARLLRPGPVRFAPSVTLATPDRSYMVNEQFTWLTPFSQQESPGLPGATRDAEDRFRTLGTQETEKR